MNSRFTITGFADEIDPRLDAQLALLQTLGICHIEMRSVNGRQFVDHTLAEAAAVKQQLDAACVRLSSIGSPIGKIFITEDFEPHYDLFRHTVQLAKQMETPNIRIFSFLVPEGEDAEQYTDEVLRRTQRMVEYAAQENVVLLHENEKDIYGDIAPRCKLLLERFYGPHYKAVFDFANFVQCGQDTMEAYDMLRPYISYVHVKDAKFLTAEVTPAGEGDGQVEPILRRLVADGYHGFLSLEPHLIDFDGFAALEQSEAAAKQELTGAQAFCKAYDALQAILTRIAQV